MVRLALFFVLFTMASVSAGQEVDVNALEALAAQASVSDSGSEPMARTCSADYEARLGKSLPDDFDPCAVGEQSKLLHQGLYLSSGGVIKPLPSAERAVPELQPVAIPSARHEPVQRKHLAPIVLNLETIERQPVDSNRNDFDTDTKVVANANASTPASTPPDRREGPSPELTRADPLGCPAFATFAHRGSVIHPENSVEATVAALQDGHTGVEIDVQRLRDGQWVVHHDLTVGRTTHGRSGLVSSMSTYHWKQVRLKERDGDETDTPAPFLEDVLVGFKAHARPSQVLNIEIKSGPGAYACADLAALDKVVRAFLTPSHFLYSSRSLENLACLRTSDSNGYLGLVIDPHPESIRSQTKGEPQAQSSNWLSRLSEKVDLDGQYKQQSNRSFLTKSSFTDVHDLVGPNFGLHIDYQDYETLAMSLRQSGGRVVLYQLDDDEGLQTLLASLNGRGEASPDGVLVDGARYEYCAGDYFGSQ